MSRFNLISFVLSRQRIELLALVFCLACLSAFLANKKITQDLDWLYYDTLQSVGSLPETSDIVLIEIDDKSLAELGRWPWSRSQHAELLNRLSASNARAIFFDVLFSDRESGPNQADWLFAQAIESSGNVYLPIHFEKLGQHGTVIEVPPAGLFYKRAASVGHVHIETSSDGIVRSVFLKEGVESAYWPHISVALQKGLSGQSIKELPGQSDSQSIDASFAIHRDHLNLISLPRSNQGLRHVSYSDVISKRINLEIFEDSLIFVGATAAGLGDIVTTSVGPMAGVELNAWIYQNLRYDRFIQPVPGIYHALLSALFVIFICLFLATLSPRAFLIGTISAGLAVLFASLVVLSQFKLWFAPFPLLLGVILFFPFWSWLRIERALRFLQREYNELSIEPIGYKNSSAFKPEDCKDFLKTLKLIEDKPSLTLSSKGIVASAKIFKTKLQINEIKYFEEFWLNRIAKLGRKTALKTQKVSGVELIAKTISQVSIAKKSAASHRRLIEQSLSQLQDSVCMADILGNITFFNPSFQKLFESELGTSSALLPCVSKITLSADKQWPEVLLNIFDEPRYFKSEAVFEAMNTDLLCQIALISTASDHYDTFLISFTNISELKAAERARAEALSFLSHDLRSPMVSVLAILEQAKRPGQNESLDSESLFAIEELVKRNLDYADNFLHLSRAESITENDFQLCDLHAVLDSAHAYARAKITSTNYQLKVSRCEEDAWAIADQSLLERAMANLVSNAVKYGLNKGCIELKLERDEENIVLSVGDQGEGIQLADRMSIFEKFTRLDDQKQKPGAGLGLNFVSTVAKKHSGLIELTNNNPSGCVFRLQIPIYNMD